MSDKLDRVRALIARALDTTGTSEEERRTAAVIAVRLIHENGLIDGCTATRVEYRERVVYREGPERVVYRDRPVYADRPPLARRRVIESKFFGRCQGCGCRYDVGDPIAWSRTEGVRCMSCHQGENDQVA